MYVIVFQTGGKTYYLKNHALAALGYLIDEQPTETVLFENEADAQKVCRLLNNGMVREEREIRHEGKRKSSNDSVL